MASPSRHSSDSETWSGRKPALWLFALVAFAAFVRLVGLDWDQWHHFHPDERAISDAVGRLSFDPSNLQLNPRWFNYGSLPLYVTALVSTVLGWFEPALRNYDYRILLGRGISAVAGTLTVLLLVMLGTRLHGRRVGLLAGFLLAACVLHVQNSHFSTTDVFLAFLVLGALYLLIKVVQHGRTIDYFYAGCAIGFAAATKFSALPLLAPLGVAVLVRLYEERTLMPILGKSCVALLGVALAFALGQPYALLDFETFWSHITEQSRMVRNAGLLPYTNQYVGTPKYFYELEQMVLWGMAPPLGIAAVVATGVFAVRAIRERAYPHVVLLSWVLPYFLVTGWFEVKFPRYLLPIYPVLILWAAAWLWEGAQRSRLRRIGMWTVIAGTFAALLAFLSIYQRPHTIVTASEWVYQHIPEGSTVLTQHWDEGFPFAFPGRSPTRYTIRELPYYEPDTPAKMRGIANDLAAADYMAFQTKRLYGAITQAAEKYPLTNNYFHLLFAGDLGYTLIYDHDARPGLLGWEFPDELGDESLTVYDHPKVLIFQNTAHLSADEIYENVLRGRPSKKLTRGDLLLAEAGDRGILASQETPAIRSSWLALLWFVALVEILGLAALPLVRRCLPVPGAYALAKVLGILAFAYIPWLLGSTGLTSFSRGTLVGTLALLLLCAWLTRHRHGERLRIEWWPTELLFWGVFALFLIVRAFNPEIYWGEKPMDFSFLNTLTRAGNLPPPEPWAAGYTLHYSYFGHFMVAALGKLCHIHPGLTFNLGIALFGGLTAVAVFAVGCALTNRWRVGLLAAFFATLIGNLAGLREYIARQSMSFDYFWATSRVIKDTINEYPFWSFLFADLHAHVLVMPLSLTFVALSLWWVRRTLPAVLQSGKPAAAPPVERAPSASSPSSPHTEDQIELFPTAASPAGRLSISRSEDTAPAPPTAPPATQTEEPAKTTVLEGEAVDRFGAQIATVPLLFLLGLTLGSIMVTNTWSTFTYAPFFPFLLGCFYLGTRGIERHQLLGTIVVLALVALLVGLERFFPDLPAALPGLAPEAVYTLGKVAIVAVGALLLYPTIARPTAAVAGLAALLYLPYLAEWSAPQRNWGWEGDAFAHFYDYANIFGLFLWVAAWFLFSLWRRQLLPPGRTRLPNPQALALWFVGLGIFALLVLTLPFTKLGGPGALGRFLHIGAVDGGGAHEFAAVGSVRIGLALLGVLALHLALQRTASQLQRGIAILFSFGFFVTAGVDVVHVWDRMNTVFKFYLEAWFLFAVAAAAATHELWKGLIPSTALRRVWQCGLLVLVGIGLFTAVTAVVGVINTRRVNTPRPTLDGTAYLPLREPHEAAAFEWINREIAGIPVIAEAWGPSYQDFTRVSMHTGLPTVLGWDYHVHQRTIDWSVINERKADLEKLYTSSSRKVVAAILKKYHVSLVYVGPIERRVHGGANLTRFKEWQDLLMPLYQNAGVSIFGVTGQFTGARPITTIEEVVHEGAEERQEQSAPGQFKQPRGVAVDREGNVYVADFDNHRIQKFSPDLDFIAAWGDQGNLPGQFKQPCELALDSAGNLYVADTWNQRVQVLTGDGEYLREWGGGFFGPRGISVAPNGKVYLADTGNNRIRRFSPEGAEELNWGGPGGGPGEFKEPYGIATDSEGRVYVCDNGNARIQIFDENGRFSSAFPVEGWKSEVFSEPKIAVAPDGTIWVTVPLAGVVRAYDRSGKVVREITGKEMPMGQFEKPLGIAYSVPFRELFVTDLANRLARIPLPVK